MKTSKQLFRNSYYKTVAMNTLLQKTALSFLLVVGLLVQSQSFAQYNDYNNSDNYGYNDNQNRNGEVTYQDFYDDLSPYGRWVDYPGQGYVWVPDAEADFQPYSTNGHWVWTEDYEWMWVSDYDWGWAPFHYGRWDRDDYYGWYWVPGYEWSPAWVAWRDGGDYYGWAPLRPGINISINIGSYNPPQRFWCFTPRRYITSQRWYDYRVDWRTNASIINYTTIINYNTYNNNYGFRSGPRRYDAERYCGRINPVRFRESYTAGRTVYRNNEVNIYRPRVNQGSNNRTAPQRFERYDRNNGRTNGDFRGSSNNGRINNDNGRRPDDRDRTNTGGGFRREENNNGRNGQQGNRIRENNRPQPEVNNGGNRNNDGRINRPDDRGTRQQGQVSNNGNGNRQNGQSTNSGNTERRFERPQQPERRYEPAQQPQQPNRQIERRNDGNGNTGQRTRTYEQPQRQPQQAERRVETPQQQPARQFERRSDNGNGGNGNRNIQGGRAEGRNRGRF